MVGIAIVGILSTVSIAFMRGSLGESRAKGSIRSVADLMSLARSEAIRTGDNHVVFFYKDAEDLAITGPAGGAAAALLIRDLDTDGKVDAGEKVAAVRVDPTGSLGWGSSWAAASNTQAPNDNPGATFPQTNLEFVCCSFLEPDADPARWVVFLPDGMPRSFSVNPFAAGAIASGSGAVYVTSGRRDYAVVLAPLGGARVHAWAKGAVGWTQ
jgi:Tfp pilus assembly protein FimT